MLQVININKNGGKFVELINLDILGIVRETSRPSYPSSIQIHTLYLAFISTKVPDSTAFTNTLAFLISRYL